MIRVLVPMLAVLLLSAPAWAKKPRKIEIGVGAAGFMNGQFLSEPAENKKFVTIEGTNPPEQRKVPYPGFWGIAGGGGVTMNAMYRGFIGMELDLFYSRDSGKGEINIGTETEEISAKIDMGQGAFHIPLLAKAAIPLKTVRPFVLLGPEFVLPGDAEADADEVLGDVGAEADPYINLATGIGCEFLLPVSGVDLRIPFSIRGSFNLSTPEGLDGRVKIKNYDSKTGLFQYDSFNTEWEYQTFIMLGLTWYQYVD